MMKAPESPIFYLRTEMVDKARESLRWLRGSDDFEIEEEFKTVCNVN